MEDEGPFNLHNQYQDFWCPGGTQGAGGIDLVVQEYASCSNSRAKQYSDVT